LLPENEHLFAPVFKINVPDATFSFGATAYKTAAVRQPDCCLYTISNTFILYAIDINGLLSITLYPVCLKYPAKK